MSRSLAGAVVADPWEKEGLAEDACSVPPAMAGASVVSPLAVKSGTEAEGSGGAAAVEAGGGGGSSLPLEEEVVEDRCTIARTSPPGSTDTVLVLHTWSSLSIRGACSWTGPSSKSAWAGELLGAESRRSNKSAWGGELLLAARDVPTMSRNDGMAMFAPAGR